MKDNLLAKYRKSVEKETRKESIKEYIKEEIQVVCGLDSLLLDLYY